MVCRGGGNAPGGITICRRPTMMMMMMPDAGTGPTGMDAGAPDTGANAATGTDAGAPDTGADAASGGG
jgi:hypothetical protein